MAREKGNGVSNYGPSLMTTFRRLLLNVAPWPQIATALRFAAIAKQFATRVHLGHGLIDCQVAKRLVRSRMTASAMTLDHSLSSLSSDDTIAHAG